MLLFFPFLTVRVIYPLTNYPDFDKLCGRLLKQPLLTVAFDARRVWFSLLVELPNSACKHLTGFYLPDISTLL